MPGRVIIVSILDRNQEDRAVYLDFPQIDHRQWKLIPVEETDGQILEIVTYPYKKGIPVLICL